VTAPSLALPAAHAIADIRAAVRQWREQGLSVGFVPTMGALHEGHLALVRAALAGSDRVVASIFVNPAQFAPGEDYETYPRTLESDAQKLAATGCHLIYAPSAAEMYPEGYATSVTPAGPAEGLESAIRPHFFTGVATVVAKLLNQVLPDAAWFGEKDYQQLLVIRRLAADLDLGVKICAGETVREPDGLALSSRNAYLTPDERERAASLNRILAGFARALEKGAPVREAEHQARAACGPVFDSVDYVEARCAGTLAPLPEGPLDRPARVLGAVRLGTTRLIDNLAANPPRA